MVLFSQLVIILHHNIIVIIVTNYYVTSRGTQGGLLKYVVYYNYHVHE